MLSSVIHVFTRFKYKPVNILIEREGAFIRDTTFQEVIHEG